jgi:hypothetical protein
MEQDEEFFRIAEYIRNIRNSIDRDCDNSDKHLSGIFRRFIKLGKIYNNGETIYDSDEDMHLFVEYITRKGDYEYCDYPFDRLGPLAADLFIYMLFVLHSVNKI